METALQQTAEQEHPEQNPLFYKKVTLLNRLAHRDLRVGASPGAHRFAKTANAVLLTANEFVEAARTYTIAFAQDSAGNYIPLALLGLEEHENLFVDEEGTWLADYIPAYVRRYPFITADHGDNGLGICIDEAFDGIGAENGARLFSDNGEPSEYCNKVSEFVSQYHAQHENTMLFTQCVSELGLFEKIDATAETSDGQKFVLRGLYTINEQRLLALPIEKLEPVFRNGQMGLIYAHLLSIKNLGQLIDKKAAQARNSQ